MAYDIYFNESYFASRPTLKEAKEAALIGNEGKGNKYAMIIIRPNPLDKWEYNNSQRKWIRKGKR